MSYDIHCSDEDCLGYHNSNAWMDLPPSRWPTRCPDCDGLLVFGEGSGGVDVEWVVNAVRSEVEGNEGRFRDAIIEAQWSSAWGPDSDPCCPWCGQGDHRGHRPDCVVQLALQTESKE